jgi:hypothetical protein
VTSALHEMEVGAVMGIRGFQGNSWPIDYLAGKNIVIVGGGFAFTTLRSLINYMIDERNHSRFGKITRKSRFLVRQVKLGESSWLRSQSDKVSRPSEPSFAFMQATAWVKRKQGDRRP